MTDNHSFQPAPRSRLPTPLDALKGMSLFILLLMVPAALSGDSTTGPEADAMFEKLMQADWDLQFKDPGTKNWRKNWHLDGLRADVKNTPGGMYFTAGQVSGDNASHAVLWTRKSFSGDIRIEYDYRRMDTIWRLVNILYIQATGLGTEEFPTDILEWSDDRKIPYMSSYFRNMNLLHISYAAFSNPADAINRETTSYIRARRYPARESLADTLIPGGNEAVKMFAPGERHKMQVVKRGRHLAIRVQSPDETVTVYWDTSMFPEVTHGPIGFRHMWTRAAEYSNIKVWTTRDDF